MIAAISDRFEPYLFNKAFGQSVTSQPRKDLDEVITVVTELFRITESPSIGGLEKDVMNTLPRATIMDH